MTNVIIIIIIIIIIITHVLFSYCMFYCVSIVTVLRTVYLRCHEGGSGGGGGGGGGLWKPVS